MRSSPARGSSCNEENMYVLNMYVLNMYEVHQPLTAFLNGFDFQYEEFTWEAYFYIPFIKFSESKFEGENINIVFALYLVLPLLI